MNGPEGYIPDPSLFHGETPYISKRLMSLCDGTLAWTMAPNVHFPTPMLDMMKNLVGGILKPLPWVIKQGNCIFDRQQRRDFIYLATNWRERCKAASLQSPQEFGEMLQEHQRKRTCPSSSVT